MTKPVPDFDVEKRRRWYAAWLGCASSITIIIILLIQEPLSGDDEDIWMVLGVWLFLAVFIGISAYALWFKPYNGRIRAIALSMIAVFLGLLSAIGVTNFMESWIYGFGNPFNILRDVIEISWDLLGAPYLVAIIVGWIFARSAPDVREHF